VKKKVALIKKPVVLLHGLARTARSMNGLAKYLRAAGHPTHVYAYASRTLSIDAAARDVEKRIRKDLGDAPFDAVTHSLGGILLRHCGDRLGLERLVMLAPPNQGSRVAASVGAHPLFRWFFGPAGHGVVDASTWPIPDAEIGVIAGTRVGVNPIGWYTNAGVFFAKDELNDGTVSVEETKLKGMAAFATVPASHTFIMDHAKARKLIVAFLDTGRFP